MTFREVGADAGLEARTEKRRSEYGLGVRGRRRRSRRRPRRVLANDTNPNRLYRNVRGREEPRPTRSGSGSASRRFRPRPVSTTTEPAWVWQPVTTTPTVGWTSSSPTRGMQGHGVFRAPLGGGRIGATTRIPTSFGDDAYTGWGVSWLDSRPRRRPRPVVANGDIPLTDLAEDAQPLQAFVNPGDSTWGSRTPAPSSAWSRRPFAWPGQRGCGLRQRW